MSAKSAARAAKAARNTGRAMASITSESLSGPAKRPDRESGLRGNARSFWHQFFLRAFDPYRPELHYMRGPGPAWRAKQNALSHLQSG
jgi:hypothetical protein